MQNIYVAMSLFLASALVLLLTVSQSSGAKQNEAYSMCCDNNFTCMHESLQSALMASENFSNFSRAFLLNEHGPPNFVYIGIAITYFTCNDSLNDVALAGNITDVLDQTVFVWGRSPSAALFGPVQEAFYFSTFDPLLLVGSLILNYVLSVIHPGRTNTFQRWLNVDYPEVSIFISEEICFNKKFKHRLQFDIDAVLLQLLKKSEELATRNQISFPDDGHAVHYKAAHSLLQITLALHVQFMVLLALIIILMMTYMYKFHLSKEHNSIKEVFNNKTASKWIEQVFETIGKLPYYPFGILLVLHAIISCIIIGATWKDNYRLSNRYENEFGYMRLYSTNVLLYLEFAINLMSLFVSFICGILVIIFSVNLECRRRRRKSQTLTSAKLQKADHAETVAKACLCIGVGIKLWLMIQQLIPMIIHAIVAPKIMLALSIQYLCTLLVIAAGVIIFSVLVNHCCCAQQQHSYCNCICNCTCKTKQKRDVTPKPTADVTPKDTEESTATTCKKIGSTTQKRIILITLLVIMAPCFGIVTCFTLLSGIGILLGITKVAITGVLGSLLIAIVGGVNVNFINKALANLDLQNTNSKKESKATEELKSKGGKVKKAESKKSKKESVEDPESYEMQAHASKPINQPKENTRISIA